MTKKKSIQTISVIVPMNPFVSAELQHVKHCLTALDVTKLMEWWPGQPHFPHRKPEKVTAIQRSLDWKRVVQIAAYLLQKEIVDAPDQINQFFSGIYEPKKHEPGREWPPRVPRVIGYERSEYPTFSNVLLHLHGAEVALDKRITADEGGQAATLIFDEDDKELDFTVIDGQHRINGAYLAVCIRRDDSNNIKWEIPAEIFIDLDGKDEPPRRQAQIFIDVNFYQKKVDRSLVADLFPTARGKRGPLDNKERAQDLGRKLMLEVGPLKGMIQIPGIKFGVKDVVALATLNAAIEDVLDDLFHHKITGLDAQAEFLAQCLDAWLEATGWKEDVGKSKSLNPNNVAYQGRVIISFLTLIPACIWKINKVNSPLVSDGAMQVLVKWLHEVMRRAGLLDGNRFLSKWKFKEKGFLGSGGMARIRDVLWAAIIGATNISSLRAEELTKLAERHRQKVRIELIDS